MTQIFLTGTNGSIVNWADPGDWNPVNKVELIGAGGPGATGVTDAAGGGGGAGGAYAIANNMTLTFPVKYAVFNSGTGLSSCTMFNSTGTAFSTTPGELKAENGRLGGTGNGGAASTQFFPAGFAGGKGGNTSSNGFGDRGGGGGGAGGPSGAGVAGAVGSTTAAGVGGTGNGGTVAGGGVGAAGGDGTQFDATHGCGGGGGGSPWNAAAGRGGNYGGGGGGGGNNDAGFRTGGAPAQGLIIITYTPLAAPKAGLSFNMPMMGI